jgi:hypothetical protein
MERIGLFAGTYPSVRKKNSVATFFTVYLPTHFFFFFFHGLPEVKHTWKG